MTKILVIEDEPGIRGNILDLLDAEGFIVSGAENGRQGLRVIREGQIPDLIICDVMMPEVDGYGVLAELRKDPATSAIPFIFLTAKADRSDLRHGMELGADDFITKPFTRDDLLKAISSRLTRAQAVRENAETEFDQMYQPVNEVHLQGFLVEPARLFVSRSGQPRIASRVEVWIDDEHLPPKKPAGVDYFSVVAFGTQFVPLLTQLTDDREVSLSGRLRSRDVNIDGRRVVTEIVAREIVPLKTRWEAVLDRRGQHESTD